MKKIKKIISDNAFIIAASLISILIVFSPNLMQDIIIGSDHPFHLARIETLAIALERGEFPIKVHTDLCYGFGYGVGFFYSNFFLYIPAILMNLGFSLEVSYKLFAALIQVGIFCGMFLAAYRIGKNKYVALVAAILYQFSIVVLESFYMHFTMGRSEAMVFLPMAIAGFYLLIDRNSDDWLLIIGFAGLVYSHVLTTVLTVLACLTIALLGLKKWIGNFDKWKKLLRAVGIVLVIDAAYWMPLLEQWMVQTYRAAAPWTFVDENVMRFYDILTNDGMGIVLVAVVILLGLWLVERKENIASKQFCLLGLVFGLLPAFSLFWNIFRNIFKFLQFPKRLLVVATVLLIFAIVLALAEISISESILKIVIGVLLIVSIYNAQVYLENKIENREDFGYRILHEEIAGLGSGEEWLPIQTTREYLVNPTIAFDSNGNQIEGIKSEGKFTFNGDGTSTYYDIPFVWYKGYAAQTMDGENLEITQVPETGMVRVMMNQSVTSKEITVWYKGTNIQKMSYIITLMGTIGLIIYGGVGVNYAVRKKRNLDI